MNAPHKLADLGRATDRSIRGLHSGAIDNHKGRVLAKQIKRARLLMALERDDAKFAAEIADLFEVLDLLEREYRVLHDMPNDAEINLGAHSKESCPHCRVQLRAL
jgi:hypothetical protein